jgi:hypothetical protein
MDRQRRTFLAGAAASASLAALPARAEAPAGIFTPEQFGAKGDGVTNDHRALAKLAEAVNAAGGGTIQLRKATYIVGEQRPTLDPAATYYYLPSPLLAFSRCARPIVIRGNGATLRCADGLLYGTFDQAGRPAHHPLPYAGPGAATPYQYMIVADHCPGGIEISDIELDGNLKGLRLGGDYGDHGKQIPMDGIALSENTGPEVIRNVYSHHHGMDGVIIDGFIDDGPSPVGAAARKQQRLVRGLRSEYNGRQGLSIVGGRGYVFEQCKFNHTGRAGIMSKPGAGVDIEAENGKLNRDFTFTDCEFIDNAGEGLVADSGDSEGATFTRCTFVGTTGWAAWPRKPRFRFHGCRFVGATVHAFGDVYPDRAAHFYDCTFLDDPKLSPTGSVTGAGQPILDLSDGKNVLLSGCAFRLTGDGLLPSSREAVYEDCTMVQHSARQASPKGVYRGRNTIAGNVDLEGSTVVAGAEIVVNGRPWPR